MRTVLQKALHFRQEGNESICNCKECRGIQAKTTSATEASDRVQIAGKVKGQELPKKKEQSCIYTTKRNG